LLEAAMSPKCPKCGTVIPTAPDPLGFVACPHCGVRLRLQPASAPAVTPGDVQTLIGEIRGIRRMQGEILQMQAQMLAHLKSPAALPASTAPSPPQQPSATDSGPAEPTAAPQEAVGGGAPPIPRVRQRRKTVLVVDDDEQTLKAAVATLEQAEIPIRTAKDGNAALAAMAEAKPDVLVLELAIGDPMPGKDLINYVKATMEWIDVPIVLYTRLFVQNQREARTVHGADEVVVKGPGSPEALLNRVIFLFQHH
jgi:CheY-like chemotaxis protein/DNA-directed RNA polymerase subunit RPC12/RpoP